MNLSRRITPSVIAVALAPALLPDATAQVSQRLAFTGGAMFNVKVNFRNLGGYVSSADPGPSSGGLVDRTYDNGFNRVDAAGNVGNTTVNWGYQAATQVRGESLVMSTRSSAGGASVEDVGDGILPSANLQYRGQMGHLGRCEWGLLFGVGYAHLDAESNQSLSADATLLEDRFSLAGTAPADLPPAPYAGGPGPEGPRIGSVPSRTTSTIPGGLTVAGSRKFEADLVPLSAGLYLECPLAGDLTAVLGVGGLATWIDGQFSYTEANTIGTLPPQDSQGDHDESDFIFGGFVELGLNWQVWQRTSVVLSGRWQPMTSFELGANGREAEVEFESSFAAYAGFALSF